MFAIRYPRLRETYFFSLNAIKSLHITGGYSLRVVNNIYERRRYEHGNVTNLYRNPRICIRPCHVRVVTLIDVIVLPPTTTIPIVRRREETVETVHPKKWLSIPYETTKSLSRNVQVGTFNRYARA